MDQQCDETNPIASVNEADRCTHLANERAYLAWVAHWIATLGVAKSFQRLPKDLGRPTRCSVQALQRWDSPSSFIARSGEGQSRMPSIAGSSPIPTGQLSFAISLVGIILDLGCSY